MDILLHRFRGSADMHENQWDILFGGNLCKAWVKMQSTDIIDHFCPCLNGLSVQRLDL